jgi:hypothetical protein
MAKQPFMRNGSWIRVRLAMHTKHSGGLSETDEKTVAVAACVQRGDDGDAGDE